MKGICCRQFLGNIQISFFLCFVYADNLDWKKMLKSRKKKHFFKQIFIYRRNIFEENQIFFLWYEKIGENKLIIENFIFLS